MSSTLLRSVSSPPPSTMAFLASGSASASAVARNRVPTSAPAAPSASAAATPRPSAIPPAASTGTGATRSTTAGTNASVDHPRRAPCPPASVPCATITSAPTSTACRASARSVTWMIKVVPDRRTISANGRGSPNESMTARGSGRSAYSTAPGSIAQLWNPTPHGREVPSRPAEVPRQPLPIPVAAAHQPEPAAVRHRRRQRPAGRSAHRRQRDRVRDPEHLRERRRQRHDRHSDPIRPGRPVGAVAAQPCAAGSVSGKPSPHSGQSSGSHAWLGTVSTAWNGTDSAAGMI